MRLPAALFIVTGVNKGHLDPTDCRCAACSEFVVTVSADKTSCLHAIVRRARKQLKAAEFLIENCHLDDPGEESTHDS